MTTRGQQLSDAISVAEKFDNDLREVLRILTDAQDNLLSQDTPGIEPATVEEQLRELQVNDHCHVFNLNCNFVNYKSMFL